MKKPHWFPFFANDFLASSKVALMSTEEIGAYLLLLCHQWNDPKCTIPSDAEMCQKLSRSNVNLEKVFLCFKKVRGRFVNVRLYKEWEHTMNNKKLASEHASMRWQNVRNASALPRQCSSPSPSPSPSEGIKNKRESVHEDVTLPAIKAVDAPKRKKRVLRSIEESDAPTDKHRALAAQLKLDIGPEWAKFKNNCLAHDKRYANFEAAFRNWLARSDEFRGARRVL